MIKTLYEKTLEWTHDDWFLAGLWFVNGALVVVAGFLFMAIVTLPGATS